MTELEKLVHTWEQFKPVGTPHEHIWNGFISDTKAAIEREKQALSKANVMPSLPSDSETEKWFIENIGVNNDCSASSAIYKFRLWLKERFKNNEA